MVDFVADLRAPTPSAAAELGAPVRAELLAGLADLAGRLAGAALRLAERRRAELRSLARALPSGEALLAGPRQRLDGAAAGAAGPRPGRVRCARAWRWLISRAGSRDGARRRRASPGLAERRRGLAQRLARAGATRSRAAAPTSGRRHPAARRRSARRKPPRAGAGASARPVRGPAAPRARRSAAPTRRTLVGAERMFAAVN